MIEWLTRKERFIERMRRGTRMHRIQLSIRETEIIYYILHGCTIKQIAQKMLVSPRTVESYFFSLKSKLNCYSRTKLMRKVLKMLSE